MQSRRKLRFRLVLSFALFGFGLSLSTMIQPEVVLGFLRFQDFGLMLVMGGAVVVTLLTYRFGPPMPEHEKPSWAKPRSGSTADAPQSSQPAAGENSD